TVMSFKFIRGARICLALFMAVFAQSALPSALVYAEGNGNNGNGGGQDPAGNNGTIKVDDVTFDDHPNNEPHVGCSFQVDFYGYDEGDYYANVSFELKSPTKDGRTLDVANGNLNPFIGEDDSNGGASEAGLDASETYTLNFTGQPQAQQGYHVKLTINAPGSQGKDTKHKVFWVEGCNESTPPVQVTPTKPSKADVCGTTDDTYTIPEIEGVSYYLTYDLTTPLTSGDHPTNGDLKVKIVAKADDGYVFTNGKTQQKFKLKFTDKACQPAPVVVTPKQPKTKDRCGTDRDFYIIKNTKKVTYYLSSDLQTALADGRHSTNGAQSVSITAFANQGYVFDNGQTFQSFTLTFTDESCQQPPVDVCLNLTGIQATIPEGLVFDQDGNCLKPADIDFTVRCTEVLKTVTVTLTNSGELDGQAVVNDQIVTVPAGASVDVPVAVNLVGNATIVLVINDQVKVLEVPCTPGKGGGPVVPPVTKPPVKQPVVKHTVKQPVEMPAELPATGSSANPLLAVLAGALAYGAVYLTQARRRYDQAK
ncbi:MAG TPA: hypothetical protein VFK03_02995, partial [Candidatus Saccharimonadales bacterium]|nr:hypothetical protein [Candidatus Saccharimonadales bacterium]